MRHKDDVQMDLPSFGIKQKLSGRTEIVFT